MSLIQGNFGNTEIHSNIAFYIIQKRRPIARKIFSVTKVPDTEENTCNLKKDCYQSSCNTKLLLEAIFFYMWKELLIVGAAEKYSHFYDLTSYSPDRVRARKPL